jgi:8-oxo-dGTP pyrophosphatase MutT (NUDIX family)
MPDLSDGDAKSARRAAMLLIVTEDGGLLMHHRDDKPGIPNPDCWAGFGGAVEDGETVQEAVRREVREETGLRIADPIFLTETVDHEGDGRAVSLFYIVAGVSPEDIDLQEGAGVGVHRVEDLPGLKITPFVRRAIYSHLLPAIAGSLLRVARRQLGRHQRGVRLDGEVQVLRGHVADQEAQGFAIEVTHHAEQAYQALRVLRGDLLGGIHAG